MQWLKHTLRLLMAGGSVLGFLGGWVLLAHAGKPAPVTTPAPVIVAQPAPSFNGSPFRLQPLPSSPSFSVGPRLRTRGS